MLLLLASLAHAAPQAKAVHYTLNGTSFTGTIVYDDATTAARPGLLMVPNWYWANDLAVEKAKAIAGTKYVVFVADVYGDGVRPKNADEAGKAAGALYGDRTLLRARANAALAAFKGNASLAPVDVSHLAAIGFCFGGSTVLELARSGTALSAVVSFHGGVATPSPATAGTLHAPILALNGAADTYVSADDLAAFQKEMADAKADWQLVQLGGAVHCFTEPTEHSPGCMYDAKAASRAYAMMDDFLAASFAP